MDFFSLEVNTSSACLFVFLDDFSRMNLRYASRMAVAFFFLSNLLFLSFDFFFLFPFSPPSPFFPLRRFCDANGHLCSRVSKHPYLRVYISLSVSVALSEALFYIAHPRWRRKSFCFVSRRCNCHLFLPPSMDTAIATTRASSSGKVLILGGYLIVEAPNVGISVGTTARFETRLLTTRDAAKGRCCVRIHSPQFGKEFAFECTVESTPEPAVSVAQTEGTNSPFLRYSVLYTVAAAISRGGNVFKELTLELLADNDFYSQRNYLESQGKEVTAANLRLLPPHLPLVGDVSKTGLGSSAAMTTSMVACLYRLLTAQSISDNNENNTAAKTDKSAEKEIVHRVAQVAHSVAQGKIGSGFRRLHSGIRNLCVPPLSGKIC
ncbi:hypothetical protein TCDM_03152 [Trypanosoma cruzi Dm28c]|uniref:phosphomevalonate kinase n=1 Tax=Trypanosoma cruzi Dm28c TaxID=1416333 RepID=V5BPT7_TRYCR|nr:hypothetical protein TCDM_03152 [Trypanosoma cruzi Dm28c]